MMMTTAQRGTGQPMTFEAFAALYRATFAKMMSYTLEQVGSSTYCEQLAALADEYPEWAERVESENR